MKILTWNVHRRNRNTKEILQLITESNADVVCLQEFPADLAEHLQKLSGYHMATEEESFVVKGPRGKSVRMVSVLLSKYPLIQHRKIQHKKQYHDDKKANMRRYSRFQAHSFYADIDAEGKHFRVFNAHFKCVAGPHHRLSQFKDVLKELSHDRENIICGDFNTFGTPLLNIVLWKIFGYQRNELLVSERREFASLFEKHGFQNPLEGHVTFLPLPAQLDYILISKHTKVVDRRFFLNPRGSDHLPVMMEI